MQTLINRCIQIIDSLSKPESNMRNIYFFSFLFAMFLCNTLPAQTDYSEYGKCGHNAKMLRYRAIPGQWKGDS